MKLEEKDAQDDCENFMRLRWRLLMPPTTLRLRTEFAATLSNTAAVDILMFAQNRLNKFYNPKLHKPPATCGSLRTNRSL